MAPTGSPSIRMIRLSPFDTAGMNFWITSGSRLPVMWISTRASRLGSPAFSLTTPEPAAPCRGLSTTSPWRSWKSTRATGSELIRVGGVRPGNWVTSSFSGALRTSAGSFTTSVFGCTVSSR